MSLVVKKILLFIACLMPLAAIVYLGFSNQLGPDPGKELVLFFGDWTIRLLLLTLAMSTLKRWTRRSEFARYRRMLGLYVWFYASLHLASVLTYLLGWSWAIFIEEFAERPYMALGISAWILLLPLGITSNNYMRRRLGRKWKSLHKLVYLIVILACGHIVWLVRSDYGEALVYVLITAILLGERYIDSKKRMTRSSLV